MKNTLRTLLLSIIALFFLANAGFATEETPIDEVSNNKSTWLRLCLWQYISWPSMESTLNTHGLSIGIATFGSDGDVIGADIGIGAAADNVKGAKLGLVTKGVSGKGFQGGIFNIVKRMTGIQLGVYNSVEDMKYGCQIALVNEAKYSKGWQIGLINLMDNGIFEGFPLFNFPASDE